MSSFFRRRNQHDQSLPTTSHGKASSSIFSNILRRNPNDGSARNIRLEKPSLMKTWHQTSVATRATYCSLLVFLLIFYMGIRWIRYSNAYIHLNCRLEACDLTVMPLGWGRKLRLDFPRRQLLESMAVKTDAHGNFVDGTPNVNDDYVQRYSKKTNKKYASPHKPSTKGPDANGHYVSYALVLTDQDVDAASAEQERQQQEGADKNDYKDPPIKDLSLLSDYLEALDSNIDINNPEQQMQQKPVRRYRLILRKFRIGQSKRRVRTILSKIDAYIKRRRTQLIVKETSPPAWQGILGIVLGLMGALLTLLIGQLWDDVPASASGPGVRREGRGSNTSSSRSKDTMRRTTPAKYEVATSHQPQRLTTASKRNTTTVRSSPSNTTANQRDRLKQAWIQPK